MGILQLQGHIRHGLFSSVEAYINVNITPTHCDSKNRIRVKAENEKAWVAVPSPVPQLEAFALPITARTSNAEAHADMIFHTHSIPCF
uniref:hypothetical protein n=1 Tax=Prevotella sp. TaxID=59823 RepID=UPI004026D9C6